MPDSGIPLDQPDGMERLIVRKGNASLVKLARIIIRSVLDKQDFFY